MRNYAVLACESLPNALSGIFDSLLDCYARGDKKAHVYIDDAEVYEQVILMAPLYHAKYACQGHAVWYDPRGMNFKLQKVSSKLLQNLIFQV